MSSPECTPLVPPSGDDDAHVPLSAFTRVAPAPRQRRDGAWGVALLASVAFVVATGSYALRHANIHDLLRVLGDPDWAADPRNCPYPSSPSSAGAVLLSSSEEDDANDRAARLLRAAGALLPLTLAASLAGGAAALAAFRRAPLAMVKAAVGAQVALPLVAALLAAANGFPGPALALSLVAALTAAVFYAWRDRVELCARLLALASSALAGTPALVAVSLASDAASLAAAGGLGLFAAAAAANGKVVRSTAAAAAGPVCAWQPAAFAPPLAALASVVALWASLTLAQLKVFVVASSVSSWYFSPAAEGGGGRDARASPLRSALRAALGPQFGTLSLAGLVLTGTQLLRSAVDALQSAAASGGDGEESLAAGCARFLGAIVATLARGALAFLDYLTKFAVVAAAVSGRGLLASGRAATGVLRSAMLDAFGVWYFPPLLLSSWTAAAGVVWGVATGLAYSRLGGGGDGGGRGRHGGGASPPSPLPWQESAAVGAACGVLAWAALSAVASVLLSAVDALFFCYAADRARAAEEAGGERGLGGGASGGGGLLRTRAEVHEVLDRVPCGVVVQQPDGGVSYGAPVGSSGGGVKKHVPPGEMFSRG